MYESQLAKKSLSKQATSYWSTRKMRGQIEPAAKSVWANFSASHEIPNCLTALYWNDWILPAKFGKCDRTFRVQDLSIVTGLRSFYAIIRCISVIVSMAMERDGSLSGESGYVCRGRKPCPAFPMVNACQRLPHSLNVSQHTLLNLTHNMYSHTSICSLL